MRTRALSGALALVVASCIIAPAPAPAQVVDRLKRAAGNAATTEAERQIERLLREAIRCALNDPVCPREAEESGEEVIYVDEDGEVIVDDDGVPITDRDAARERAGVAADAGAGSQEAAPGEGVWANYDFVPGDDILYYDDYSGDRVGDFPRRMSFVRGNWEIVEWEDRRLLRVTGRGRPAVEIPLVEPLPERFTIEFEAHLPHGNHRMHVATSSPAADGGDSRRVEGNFFTVSNLADGTGVRSGQRGGVESGMRTSEVKESLVPIRIMVDRRYAKVYVGSKRVANVPNAELELGEALYFETQSTNRNPIYIGPIRVAAGGRDLYEDLLSDGRATTRGILFAVDSDRIRPESTPTLEEIGTMLEEHADLRLRVEGHTDSDGDEAHNLDLSERRAAAVKRYLVERHGIEDARLETAGLGESEPVADNRSAEGKQKNRRVELVRLEG